MKAKKADLKRLVALGLLAAVLGTGSVMAAEYTGKLPAGTYEDENFVLTNENVSYAINLNSGTGPTVINSKTISVTATGTDRVNLFGADVWSGTALTMGSSATESIEMSVSDTSTKADGEVADIFVQAFGNTSQATLTGNTVKTVASAESGSAYALWARNRGGPATHTVYEDGHAEITVNAGDVEISVSNKETKQDGYTTAAIGAVGLNSKVEINAKALAVSASGQTENVFAVLAQNNTANAEAPSGAASVTLKADTISITSSHAGITAFSNGQVNVTGDTTITAPNAVDVRGNSTTNINTDGAHKTVLNGDIVFETPATVSDAHGSGNKINAYVNIAFEGEGSALNGRAYQQYSDAASVELTAPDYYGNVTGLSLVFADGAAWNMTGDSFVNDLALSGGSVKMEKGAKVFNASGITMEDGGSLDLEGSGQKVTIGTLGGDEVIVNTASTDNKVTVADNRTDSLTVKDTGITADEIASGAVDAQDIADVVKDANDKTIATKVQADAGIITGAYTADVTDGKIANAKQEVNQSNAAIVQMAAVDLMTWRQENNDMNKRLGELRASKGETGVWARMTRGEAKYGAAGVKNRYNYFQVGFDKKLGDSPWTVGFAVTRTEGETSFLGGKGENDHTGAAIYGSYLKDDGSFIDIIARYARLDHEYTAAGGIGSGDYDTNGYSLSAEYGKRFALSHRLWLEPQAELTYAKVGSVEYTSSRGAKVRHEGMDSLVGRLGFSLGRDIEHGNVYLRASYLYDFEGETDIIMSRSGAVSRFAEDLGGSWWEVGFGTNLDLSKTAHLYLDFEKTYGGNVETPWQWNVGCRWSF